MKKILFLILLLFPVMVFAAKPTLISGIQVEGIGNLTLDRTTWNLTLYSTLNYTNITVAPLGDNVTITGDGKLDIVDGDNTYTITAKDGDVTETYTINIKKIVPSKDDSGNPANGAFLPYKELIFLLLVGIGMFISLGHFKRI